MKKVYLFCSAGMSTSLLVSKMQGVADSHNLPIEIQAFPESKAKTLLHKDKPDCVLLGPQVKYLLKKMKEQCEQLGIPCEIIDPATYGIMDGEKVLKQAIRMIKSKKEVY